MTFTIPEMNVGISFPESYTIHKSAEKNRRGSFVSYNFQTVTEHEAPYFYELQFFSQESIRIFTSNCEESPCFYGDYPTLERYSDQKIAFASGGNIEDFELRKFGLRSWFVSSHPCEGDSCVIREYTTFIGDTKVDVWIAMRGSDEEKQADALFAQFSIE